MLGKTDKNPQLNIGEIPLVHYINKEHELCQLAGKINWDSVENEFSVYYSTKGAPSIPIRTIVGLSLLKRIYKYSDRSALAHWLENPYWQHFCGEVYFQHKVPFYFGEFGNFRNRIGNEGEGRILKLGTDVFGPRFLKSHGPYERKYSSSDHKNPISKMLSAFGNFLLRISSS